MNLHAKIIIFNELISSFTKKKIIFFQKKFFYCKHLIIKYVQYEIWLQF